MKLPVRLYFCAITGGRWYDELEINVRDFYDYVDNLIIVDGNFKEDPTTYNELKKIDKDNKVVWVDYPWHNDFPDSRSEYLRNVGRLVTSFDIKNMNHWVLRADDDEHYSYDLIKDARRICGIADNMGIDMLAVRVHDREMNKDGSEKSNTTGKYHKGLLYRWNPTLQYIPAGWGSPVHETYNHQFRGAELDNKSGDNKETKYYYEHIKPTGEVWRRAHARNFFIGGGGPNLGQKQPLWIPYVKLVSGIMGKSINDWKIYDAYLVKGNVDKKLKDWFVQHMLEGVKNRDFKKYPKSKAEKELGLGYDGSSEVREGYKYYFKWLHPEEEPDELKDIGIP